MPTVTATAPPMTTGEAVALALAPLAQMMLALFGVAAALMRVTKAYKSQAWRSYALDFLLLGAAASGEAEAKLAAPVEAPKPPGTPRLEADARLASNGESSAAATTPPPQPKPPVPTTTTTTTTSNESELGRSKVASLLVSVAGLQTSYLLWGVMQEKIMTSKYGEEEARFPSTSLLVLSNRAFAIVFALAALYVLPQPKHKAPFVEYSFAAVANTISSFCQYEALRFVSFPMSTVCKACKIIPTMLMGTLVQGKKYPPQEYAAAAVITLGVTVFALESGKGGGVAALLQPLFSSAAAATPEVEGAAPTTAMTSTLGRLLGSLDPRTAIPGAVLLLTYLSVDAFTSNWQNRLFREYAISPYQCMLGINIFSTMLGVLNLVQEGQLFSASGFLLTHPDAFWDVMVMSLCSAMGQLFIYYTLEKHGAVVFTIISVTRQLISIALSSVMFGHVISPPAWIGVALTFAGITANALSGGGSKRGGGGGAGKGGKKGA